MIRLGRIDVIFKIWHLSRLQVYVVHRCGSTLYSGVVHQIVLRFDLWSIGRFVCIKLVLAIKLFVLLCNCLLLLDLLENLLVLDDFALNILILLLVVVGPLNQKVNSLNIL